MRMGQSVSIITIVESINQDTCLQPWPVDQWPAQRGEGRRTWRSTPDDRTRVLRETAAREGMDEVNWTLFLKQRDSKIG